jgi:hypothetical protein
MTPAEIVAEHQQGHTPRQATIDWFLSRDVPILALARSFDDGFDTLLIADVVFLDVSRFEFARYGSKAADVRPACTFVARDAAGDVVDLVAWCRTGGPASWLGRAALLGEEQLWWPRLGEPLVVHPDPLSWLQASRRGVVIVDERQAAPLLRDAGVLGAASVKHGHQLAALTRPPRARILVPQQVAA